MRDEEKKLLGLFEKLDSRQQQTLVEFAGFLAAHADSPAKSAEPVPITRPAGETVVMAIKRLTRTYPMLDRRKLFTETSRCVTQHALEGRPAMEVIDELEMVFSRHFESMKDEG